jgi:hypothetical protein
MADGTSFRFRSASTALCVALAGCASTPHIAAVQGLAIAPPPHTANLTLDADETLPFGISRERVEAALSQAGFVAQGSNAQYRLLLGVGTGSSRTGSYVPGSTDKVADAWVGHPDRSLRGRLFPGHMLRVVAVLVDGATNREVWRGTGTLRTSHPRDDAPALAQEVLARLPRQ